MKIIVTTEEVKQIVADHLQNKGFKVKPASIVKHIEGQFDESTEVLDGLSFEIELGPEFPGKGSK